MGGAAPGLLPSPSRMLSVPLSVCLFLWLTLSLSLFLSFHVHLFYRLPPTPFLPSSLLGQLGATMLRHESFRAAGAFRAGEATESTHCLIPHPTLQLVVRCSVMTGEKLEFSQTLIFILTPPLADHEILATYSNFSEPQFPLVLHGYISAFLRILL